ncbi:hypothetical protein ROA7745_01115 [Roseovarius aestuarii]|uniref:Uncharacterized protein n=2 Tax=Roseovarius aestuarii TaxID=475083 RepID=A0A1X7BNW3_9RHOB|nr:hypothetical protein ROA7745_01115 [Roseovarius aestuarii]
MVTGAETRASDSTRIAANHYGTPDEIVSVAAFLPGRKVACFSGVTTPIDGAFMSSGVIKRNMNPKLPC